MKADDLISSEVFSLVEEGGFPLFASSRTMIMGARSLSLLQSDLMGILGPEKGAEAMARHGYEAGMSTATAMAGLYHWDSDDEWLKAGSKLLGIVGLARAELHRQELDKDKKLLSLSGEWWDSLEALQWLRHHEPSAEPVCHILAGCASGYASAVLGTEVLVRETSCAAQGHAFCRFEGRPVGEWNLEPEKRRRFRTGMGVEEEVSHLRVQLQEAWQEVERQRAEIEQLNQSRSRTDPGAGVLYRSETMSQVLALCERAAPTASTVLLVGESGTGKEVLARFIHRHSGRENEPFLAVNCAALPPTLLESELFGHVRGAFTGADRDKLGLFVEAGLGTLFLDEVGDLSTELQAKLLRAVQEREVRPVGGVSNLPVKARILAATNRNLHDLVERGDFREDLYYRLAVIPVNVPPLRRRREEILPLARLFLDKFRPGHPGFTPEALRRMEEYAWPGNVRELENAVEYASVMSETGRIRPEHLPPGPAAPKGDLLLELSSDLPTESELIRRYTRRILGHTQGNQSRAARILGIDYSTLWRRLRRRDYGMTSHQGA